MNWMKRSPKVILGIVAIVAGLSLVFCLYALAALSLSSGQRIGFTLGAQVSSAFFFPIVIGGIVRWLRQQDIASALWEFVSACGEAGLEHFHVSRQGQAEKDLESRLREHNKGRILLTGPSLRLFFAPGSVFHQVFMDMREKYLAGDVEILVVNADPKRNRSLPVRSFVEDFNPDWEYPERNTRAPLPWVSDTFDWHKTADSVGSNFLKFCDEFYEKHYYHQIGEETRKCRCVSDLENVAHGISQLNRGARRPFVHLRTTVCAPYFTAVIFPDACFYSPNILYPEPPVNMPNFVFRRGFPPYQKVLTHFKFIWWSGMGIDS